MSTQTSLGEWQTAAYAKLTGDTTLMGIVTGVFDYGAVPQNQPYPFIVLGDGTELPMNAFGTRGYISTLTLHIWDNSNGFKTCQAILANMNRLLDQQILSLATLHHVYTLYNFSQTLNDPGVNNIKHMPVRYLTFAQEVVSMAAQYINVRDYGATGDGVTNDTTAINAAVTALGTAIATYGNALMQFPQGTYLVDGILIQNFSNFIIVGPGHLKLSRAKVTNALVNTNDVLTLINCTDFIVDELEIDGNRHVDVSWPTADRAPITQYLQSNAVTGQATVTVSNGALFQAGERLWICGGLTANGTTEKDFVDNNSQQGLAINMIVGNVLTLASNLTHNYTATGVAGGAYVTTYQTGYHNTVGSYLLGNEDQQNGVHLIACTRFTITKCYCHDMWESGIKCGIGFDTDAHNLGAACTYGIITNNRCIRGYDQGISVWNSQFMEVYQNYCADAGWAGCSFTGTDDSIASLNIFRDNYYRIPGDNSSGYGSVIEGGARNVISNNNISANYNAGVLLRISAFTFGVSGTTLNGNLSWNSTSIPVTSGSGFEVGATYMINDGAHSESFKVTAINTNTLTVAEKTRYFHASGKSVGVRIAEDNTIETNIVEEAVNGHGIWVSPAVRSNIRHNTVQRNGNKGITIEQSNGFISSGTIVDGNYFTGNGQANGNPAICADSVNDIQVLNNRVAGNFGDKGIQFKGVTNGKIIGNSVTDVQSDAIDCENGSVACARIVIANNDIKQCDGSGIIVQRGSHFTIMGNSCWAMAGNGGMSLGGLSHSTIKGNICIANNTNGILLLDNNSVACTWNIIEGNVVRDDGSGVKASDGSALTQGVAIKLQDNEANNWIGNNQVDHATAKVSGTTTIVNDWIN